MGIAAVILAFDTGFIATVHGGIGPGAARHRLVGTERAFEPSPEGFVIRSDEKTTVICRRRSMNETGGARKVRPSPIVCS